MLELDPGSGETQLHGRLITLDLATADQFEAVSYHWGYSKLASTINCDGFALKINSSVLQLLRQFRDPTNTRRLWVDAVCIDQTNNVEKDAQVRLMNKVFSQATTVLVWLGEADPTAKDAFDVVQEAFAAAKRFPTGPGLRPTMEQLQEHGFPSATDHRWGAVSHLLLRPWFTRTWILQEAVLAREAVLHCGRFQCDWLSFAHIAFEICHNNAYKNVFVLNISNAARIAMLTFRTKSHPLPLLGLLIATQNMGVSNQSDKVFGVLGIASDRAEFIDSISYAKSTEALYMEVFQHYFFRGQMGILNCAGNHPYRRFPSLPSWVPDWSVLHRPLDLWIPGQPVPDPRLDSPPPIISPDQRILRIGGLVRDEVRFVGKNLRLAHSTDRSNLQQMFFKLEEWRHLAKHRSKYAKPDEYFEAFARTLVANILPFPQQEFTTATDLYKAMRSKYRRCHPGYNASSNDRNFDILTYHELMRRGCVYKTFFVTRNGEIGIGPQFVRPGDLLVQLDRVMSPFALRSAKNGRYTLVGNAYVHGWTEEVDYTSPDYLEFELV